MSELLKPLLVYDGDCAFCRSWIARWRRTTGDRVEYQPSSAAAARLPEIPAREFAEAVQLVEPDGHRSRGAEAAFRALAYAPGHGFPLWLYRRVPGFAPVAEAAYRVVARHRPLFSAVTRLLWGEHVVAPGAARTNALFLRGMGVVYLAAFASLAPQIVGLIGRDGILPARDLLAAAAAQLGPSRYLALPTLAWLGSSDAMLVGLCIAGIVLAVLLVGGLAPAPCLAALWVLYLSLTTLGRDFLWFQWDSLLLEAGLIALLLAPWRWRSRARDDPEPSRGASWLARWLLFRLMVSSAFVKLASGDPTWRQLTALTYHYETQPLPPWTAWYAHHLPLAFQQFSCAVMFVIEGGVPFLIAAPRRVRFAAAAAFLFLQALIALTGNYGFFNLLTIVLLVPLLDDAVWPQRRQHPHPEVPAARGATPRALVWPAAALLAALSLVPFADTLRLPPAWLGPLPALERALAPFRTVDRYGLFAIMTTRRPEIILEGSADGLEWKAYEFKWKAGDLARRPAFVAPHMPRLDWQLWFAALSDTPRDYWYLSFCKRVLQGSRPVLALLAANPFPETPPRFLRATLYDYHFTTPAERRATGTWWTRTERGPYGPVLMLEDGRLRAVVMRPGP